MCRLNYFVVWSLLFFVCFRSAGAVESLLMKYEPGIDNEIVRVIGVDDRAQELLLIEKKFLGKRKASFDPKRSKYETYVIVDVIQKKELEFLVADVDESILFGSTARVSDGYIIPVVRQQNRIELYQYNRRTSSIQRLDDKPIPKQIPNLSGIHATKNGYITVSPKRDFVVVKFYSFSDSAGQVLSLLPLDDVVVSIADTIELNNTIYIVGVGQSDTHNRYLWVTSINLLSGGNSLYYRKNFGADQAISAKFARSHNNTLSIILSRRSSGFSPPVVSVVQLDEDPVQVWEESTKDLQGDKDYSISWVCGDKLLIAKKRKRKSKNTYYQDMEFNLVVKRNKVVNLPIAVEFENTILKDVSLYPTSNFLFSIYNFSKVEKTKRLGGWYSWSGYRVDKIDIQNIYVPCNK